MRVSDRGLCEIAGHEGIVPYPYFDSVGVLTVGIGHTASAGPPDPKSLPRGEAIPLEDVLAIFRRDVARFEARVRGQRWRSTNSTPSCRSTSTPAASIVPSSSST